MQKLITLIVLGCFLQVSFQACPDGTYQSTGGSDMASHGTCTTCLPVCKKCTSAATCTEYISKIKGIDSTPTNICSGANAYGGVVGYNSNTDTCDKCLKGCFYCAVDYNICYGCEAGWDFDQNNLQCTRATLGLAATVLALSVLSLIAGIVTCILSYKLN